MDVIEQLMAGHRAVNEHAAVMDAFAAALMQDGRFWENTQKLTIFFRTELLRHITLEEQVLFPVLRPLLSAVQRDLLRELECEHTPIRAAIQRVLALSAGSARPDPAHLTAACRAVLRLVGAHAAKEDDRLFPLLRTTLRSDDYQALEDRYAACRD